MKKLTDEKCREQFEEWFIKNYPKSRNGVRTWSAENDGDYISDYAASHWRAWQSSRNALPILEQQDQEKSIIAGQLEAVRDSLSLTPHQHAIISCAIDRINVLTSRTLELSRSLIKQQEPVEGGRAMFRKRPVVIEAVQWTGLNLHEVIAFTDGPPDMRSHHAGMMWENYSDLVKREGLKIYTLEGVMSASVGDWIIKGIKGEHYPCKPDVFEKTYEPADETAELEQQEQGDGWIEWRGGECPVFDYAVVAVRLRNYSEAEEYAGSLWWGRYPSRETDADIIAYRIIPEKPTNQSGEES